MHAAFIRSDEPGTRRCARSDVGIVQMTGETELLLDALHRGRVGLHRETRKLLAMAGKTVRGPFHIRRKRLSVIRRGERLADVTMAGPARLHLLLPLVGKAGAILRHDLVCSVAVFARDIRRGVVTAGFCHLRMKAVLHWRAAVAGETIDRSDGLLVRHFLRAEPDMAGNTDELGVGGFLQHSVVGIQRDFPSRPLRRQRRITVAGKTVFSGLRRCLPRGENSQEQENHQGVFCRYGRQHLTFRMEISS